MSPLVNSVPPNRYQEEQRWPPLRRTWANLSSLSRIVVQSFRPIAQITDTIQRLLTLHSNKRQTSLQGVIAPPPPRTQPTLIPCEIDFQVVSAKSGFREGRESGGGGTALLSETCCWLFSNLWLILETLLCHHTTVARKVLILDI